MNITIRDNIPQYMKDLKSWLESVKDVELEDMDNFFTKRVDGYEEHMSYWSKAYQRISELIPNKSKNILDLGCGTGLELDQIFKRFPNISVTGIDLCESMLDKLKDKHHDKMLTLLCEDYFKVDFGLNQFDTAISFETLHHFKPQKKAKLFKKIYHSLKENGVYLECDYIACCDEEERLLASECERKRIASNIHEDTFVHFDTPLTLEHEMSLIKEAGFSSVTAVDCINGATFILANK